MDRISLLPDDYLLAILSFLPTKDALTTSLLSKRWGHLWKLVPKLEYLDCGRNANADHGRFLRFVDRSLLSSKAPVLERLIIRLTRPCSDEDIGFWVRNAVGRGLRELEYSHTHSLFDSEPTKLPRSLFTCGTLVLLKLHNVSLVHVTFPVCFQFLKTLRLSWVIYLNDETLGNLLSSCRILEDLAVNRVIGDNVKTFSITVPSLQKLVYDGKMTGYSKFVLNVPSLKYLEILDQGYECMIQRMPEIVDAYIEAVYWNTDNILGSLTSLKRLSLCMPEESFPTGKIFHQLVRLEFCACDTKWDQLMTILKHSPKLRALTLHVIEDHDINHGQGTTHWDEPSSVPETLINGLETLKWRNYGGSNVERELVTFILKHSRSLKKATILPRFACWKTEDQMFTELGVSDTGPTTCEFVFGENFETI